MAKTKKKWDVRRTGTQAGPLGEVEATNFSGARDAAVRKFKVPTGELLLRKLPDEVQT